MGWEDRNCRPEGELWMRLIHDTAVTALSGTPKDSACLFTFPAVHEQLLPYATCEK